jgi:hypothetical protein
MEEKLGSLKPKIAPKIPTRRRKVEVKQEKEERSKVPKEWKPRVKKEKEMVASGPFAMGPAERGKKVQISHSTTQIVDIQDEIMNISSENDEDEVETEWTPVSIGKKAEIKKEFVDPLEESIVYLQLPIDLPIVQDEKDPLSTTTMNTTTTYNTIDTIHPPPPKHAKLLSGMMGTYEKYESGKIVLRIGEYEFQVQQSKHRQEQTLVSIDKDLNSLIVYGPVKDRLVASPLIDSLL